MGGLIWVAAALWVVAGWILVHRRMRVKPEGLVERIGLEEDLQTARYHLAEAIAECGEGSPEVEWWRSQVEYFQREIERADA
jgi:hypothetical protein